jgi:hypothetical protein
MAFKVVSVESTPNPNARKLMLDRRVSEGPVSFVRQDQAAEHPLASRLFAISGVTSVFLLGDFITLNKSPDARWPGLLAAARRVLAEFD